MTKDKLYMELAKDYVKEVITDDVKLNISQKLYYPLLIEFVAFKVFQYIYNDNPQNKKFLEESCERYADLFPELFI